MMIDSDATLNFAMKDDSSRTLFVFGTDPCFPAA